MTKLHLKPSSIAVTWFLTILVGSGGIAIADQWSTAVGWVCDERAKQLTLFPVRFDANAPIPETRPGFYVPTSDSRRDADAVDILSCNLGSKRKVAVQRTYINEPKPSGICGGTAWSRYQLTLNGKAAAEFPMGCSDTFVIASQNIVQVCSLDRNDCRVFQEDPIRLNRVGEWLSE